jgi:hypothetical protein
MLEHNKNPPTKKSHGWNNESHISKGYSIMRTSVVSRPPQFVVILSISPTETYEQFFDTRQEAHESMSKLNTAIAIVRAVQSLATAADSAVDLEAEYFDIGAPVDADVETLGLTASDIAACVTLLQQITALMSNEATTPAVYRATLNKVRRVPA